MAHSLKDGASGGGHRRHDGREYWSARCRKAPMGRWGDPEAKRLTHREERRFGAVALRAEVEEMLDGRGWGGADWWRIGRDEDGERCC